MWTEEQDKKIKKYYNLYKDLKSEAFFLIAAMLPSKSAKEIAMRLRELDLINDDILFAQFPELEESQPSFEECIENLIKSTPLLAKEILVWLHDKLNEAKLTRSLNDVLCLDDEPKKGKKKKETNLQMLDHLIFLETDKERSYLENRWLVKMLYILSDSDDTKAGGKLYCISGKLSLKSLDDYIRMTHLGQFKADNAAKAYLDKQKELEKQRILAARKAMLAEPVWTLFSSSSASSSDKSSLDKENEKPKANQSVKQKREVTKPQVKKVEKKDDLDGIFQSPEHKKTKPIRKVY